MPLSPSDRRFLETVDRLKVYVLLMAVGVFLLLLFTPSTEIRMVTSVVGITLCGVFWLTSRLLAVITLLDLELTRLVNAMKRTLPKDQQRGFSSSL